MLQVSYIRENSEKVIQRLSKRQIPDIENSIRKVLELDQARRQTQMKLDNTLAESNLLAKQIGGLMKNGKKEEAEAIKSKTTRLKSESKVLQEKLYEVEQELTSLLYTLPNVPHEKVPNGINESDNNLIKQAGSLPKLPEGALPHWEIIKKYDIVDFELGNKITGAGFPVYKGKGAKLQRALIQFFLDEAVKAGYMEVQPPIIINQDSGYGTGQLPDKDGQMYHIAEGDFYLIPTAEVPITNMYRESIIDYKDLPLKNVGYTPCFRKEAGSWGAHVRGLNRLHQFDKVEIVQIEHPERSYVTLQEMCAHIENLIQQLGLPYRILNLCAGDLGFTSALTYDFEVYSGGQKKWLEVSSVSNFETYQANHLRLRFRDKEHKTHLLHTLNGSALALPRIVAAILENNQSAKGIRIPDILIPYTGFDKIF